MSDFVPGFTSRHDAAAFALRDAFKPPEGFAPSDLRARAIPRGPVSFAPQGSGGPRHFSPADPDANPTAGWDPLDASAPTTDFLDPIAAAHAAGYAEGLAAAHAVAVEGHSRDEALLMGLAGALASDDRIDREQVARQLRETVLFLVTKLVGEVGIAPDILAGRIEAATDLLTDANESALLRVHPDDVALLEGRLPKTIFAAGDASIARGSFVLESASTVVEDGPALWLDQLAHAIERVPVPAMPRAGDA